MTPTTNAVVVVVVVVVIVVYSFAISLLLFNPICEQSSHKTKIYMFIPAFQIKSIVKNKLTLRNKQMDVLEAALLNFNFCFPKTGNYIKLQNFSSDKVMNGR
jgi:hypothetical protein